MKGMVFTEFLQMVEDKFSADMVDDIIDDANLASGGAYTAVGTYDHQELVAMVVALSNRTGIAVPDLVRIFGEHVFSVFAKNFTVFFDGVEDALTFLERVENIIHPQVLKLYPDATLPRFDCTRQGENQLTMIYASERHFADLAEGLMIGCGQFFGDQLQITRQELDNGNTQFTIVRM
jgi:hypothetical protein